MLSPNRKQEVSLLGVPKAPYSMPLPLMLTKTNKYGLASVSDPLEQWLINFDQIPPKQV